MMSDGNDYDVFVAFNEYKVVRKSFEQQATNVQWLGYSGIGRGWDVALPQYCDRSIQLGFEVETKLRTFGKVPIGGNFRLFAGCRMESNQPHQLLPSRLRIF
jgi:hypothetical protein